MEHRFLSFDATPIFYRRFKPSGQTHASVILVHGMSEHSGRYHETAEALTREGLEVFIPDLRGFGQSGGKRACLGSFSQFHEDLAALHRFVSQETKTPVFLLGHSLGGLIASSYLALPESSRPAGLILTSPFFGLVFKVPLWKRWTASFLARWMPDLTMDSGLRPELMTHDAARIRSYKEDPLIVHRVSARLFHEMTQQLKRAEWIASRIVCPVLLIQAGRDRIVSKKAAVEFFEKIQSARKELWVMENDYHEVLNETDRLKTQERIADWIKQILALIETQSSRR